MYVIMNVTVLFHQNMYIVDDTLGNMKSVLYKRGEGRAV